METNKKVESIFTERKEETEPELTEKTEPIKEWRDEEDDVTPNYYRD